MTNPTGADPLPPAPPEEELHALVHALMTRPGDPALEPFRAVWPAYAPPLPAPVPKALPVLDWLAGMSGSGRGFDQPLIAALHRAAPTLTWRQTYSEAELGADFLRNYGYTELIGPTAPRKSKDISCGFLLLGPRTIYPRHRHEAEEIYVILHGRAEWLQGDLIWRQRPPGTVVLHSSGEAHAMRTGEEPLLALYAWRGAGLNQKARLDA